MPRSGQAFITATAFYRSVRLQTNSAECFDVTTILSNHHSKFGITCFQCNNELIAPERSEYRNERQVHHIWRCGECNFRFESVVLFPAIDKSMRDITTGAVIFPSLFPSLLVA